MKSPHLLNDWEINIKITSQSEYSGACVECNFACGYLPGKGRRKVSVLTGQLVNTGKHLINRKTISKSPSSKTTKHGNEHIHVSQSKIPLNIIKLNMKSCMVSTFVLTVICAT